MKLKKLSALFIIFTLITGIFTVPSSAYPERVVIKPLSSTGTSTGANPSAGSDGAEWNRFVITGTHTLKDPIYVSRYDLFELSRELVNNSYSAAHPLLTASGTTSGYRVREVRNARITAVYESDGRLFQRNASIGKNIITVGSNSTGNSYPILPLYNSSSSAGIDANKIVAFIWEASVSLVNDDVDLTKNTAFRNGSFTYTDSNGNPFKIHNVIEEEDYSFTSWQLSADDLSITQSSSVLPLNNIMRTVEYLGDGKKIEKDYVEAFEKAASFDVVLNFNQASSGNETLTLATELSLQTNESFTVKVAAGARSVMLQNVPTNYFFDKMFFEANSASAEESCFWWLRLTGTNLGTLGVTSAEIFNSNRPSVFPSNNINTNTNNNNNNNNNNTGGTTAIDELVLNYKAITLGVGADNVNITADGYTADKLRFAIASPDSNGDVISIYSTGRIQAVKTGRVTVNVSLRSDNSVIGRCVVTVVDKPTRPITTLTFSDTGGTVYLGGRYNLLSPKTATVSPANNNDEINWFSSDTTIATVDNGRVNVRGTGRATITAVTRSGITRTYDLIARMPDINMSVLSATINKEQVYTINAVPRPANAKMSFKSSNETVATVNPTTGEVTGITSGQTTVEISTDTGIVKVFTINVR